MLFPGSFPASNEGNYGRRCSGDFLVSFFYSLSSQDAEPSEAALDRGKDDLEYQGKG